MQTASELVDQTGVDGSVAGDARLGGEERGTDLEVEVWGLRQATVRTGGGRVEGGQAEARVGNERETKDDVRREQMYMGPKSGSAGVIEGWPCREEEGNSG